MEFMVDQAAGRLPVNVLASKYRWVSMRSVDHAGGREPPSWLQQSASSWSCCRLDHAGGRVPASRPLESTPKL